MHRNFTIVHNETKRHIDTTWDRLVIGDPFIQSGDRQLSMKVTNDAYVVLCDASLRLHRNIHDSGKVYPCDVRVEWTQQVQK